ncbi:tetratricopeptide repeat protein [Oceanospirillum beijerinckii]|uniref:tetratricopeptide repeat protein n=1 Tax=Oceanospirillum beijerinckii TaxID=64976 RepID=UPI00146C0FD4
MIAHQEQPSPDQYHNLAVIQATLGKVTESICTLEDGLKKYPSNAELLALISSMYLNTGKIKEGMEYAQSAISTNPRSSVAYLSYASALNQCNQVTEALAACEASLSLYPEQPEALLLKASIQARLNQNELAIQTYQQAIHIAPDWLPPYIALGDLLAESEQFDSAIEYFQSALNIAPGIPELKQRLGMSLYAKGEIDSAIQLYQEIISIKPEDAETHTLLGHALRDYGRLEEAVEAYKTALQYNPDIELARTNIQELTGQIIPAWHFDMLADSTRNEAFDQALNKRVTKNTHVLDIGTGSGLLSMMAARAGASKITTCEVVPELANVAQQIIKDNHFDHQITVINKRSTSLQVGKDIEQKADLLVCEILDSGLLGEGVLPTIYHARKNLLKDDAIIIPESADIHAVLIESDSLYRANSADSISGFNIEAFKELNTEKYTITNLASFPHKTLSKPAPVKHISFMYPSLSTETTTMEIEIEKGGTIHGIAFWFNLSLTEGVTISTAPGNTVKHWQQAIQAFKQPVTVNQKDKITLLITKSSRQISFKLDH